jgi:hypothetical protein
MLDAVLKLCNVGDVYGEEGQRVSGKSSSLYTQGGCSGTVRDLTRGSLPKLTSRITTFLVGGVGNWITRRESKTNWYLRVALKSFTAINATFSSLELECVQGRSATSPLGRCLTHLEIHTTM